MSGYNGRKLNHKLNCSLNSDCSSDSRTVCSSFTESICNICPDQCQGKTEFKCDYAG